MSREQKSATRLLVIEFVDGHASSLLQRRRGKDHQPVGQPGDGPQPWDAPEPEPRDLPPEQPTATTLPSPEEEFQELHQQAPEDGVQRARELPEFERLDEEEVEGGARVE